MTTAAPTREITTEELESLFNQPAYETETQWTCQVFDDDVNTQEYVVMVFMEHFKWPVEKAAKKMLEVHQEGRSLVFSGTKEEAELHVKAMHEYKLQAALVKA